MGPVWRATLWWLAARGHGAAAAPRISELESPNLLARARRADTAAVWAVVGECVVEGACVTSPGFPEDYPPRDSCALSLLNQPSVVSIEAFSTEGDYDTLVINDVSYSGAGDSIIGVSVAVWSNISWTSDSSVGSSGWKLCVTPGPSCDDGLPLTPVAVPQCPPVDEALPACDEAQPGELCEGDGRCGTRTDINNCYDSAYTYPASRDVYLKAPGTTRTVTSTATATTTVTSSTVSAVGGGVSHTSWTVEGDCQAVGACVRSPNYPGEYPENDRCLLSVPKPSVVEVTAFDTEVGYDQLGVNGALNGGTALKGSILVVWTDISWTSDSSVAGTGWELCLQALPSCTDGLSLAPVPVKDCPDPAEALPDCEAAEPGALCEADGQCGTRTDLDNCYDSQHSHPPSRDVYRKAVGATRTQTTTLVTEKPQTTFTATRPPGAGSSSHPGPVPWVVDGDCALMGACAESPNFPQPYGHGQSCTLSLPQPSVVRVTYFRTESEFDVLTINGKPYSGTSLSGETLVVWSNMTWASDESVSEQGCQACLEPPPHCPDGLALHPVAISECPRPSEVLPGCGEAQPGTLCEGDGRCGTRTDINNCYDSAYTHPASRDVYRKVNGSTTTTATSSSTSVTTTSLTSTVSSTQLPGFWEGPAPWAVSGDCGLHGACAESPGFPGPYGNGEACALSLPPFSVVRVTFFDTEAGEDLLVINGEAYSGDGGGLDGTTFVVWSNISWTSSSATPGKGWQVCFEPTPSCADGLPLTPVAIADCPPSGQSLPGCAEAGPGEACLGDGRCGTRQDINNCYDAAYTYPPSRDVYRKGMGTTRTTTTVTSVTVSTSLTSTSTHWNVDGLWQHVGPCRIEGDCAQGPEDGLGQCSLSLPPGTPVKLLQYSKPAELEEGLSINGVGLGPGDEGRTFLVDGDISWSSSAGGGWQACILSPSCHDGLALTPLEGPECPSSSEGLLSCEAASPGDLCVGDGECFTYPGLNNCPPDALYQKESGTTRTVTTLTTSTTTLVPSPWQVSGPCTASGACAQSPNYPSSYGPGERCQLSLPEGSTVEVLAFATEANYDRLTVNGHDYSGSGASIVGQQFRVSKNISWWSDESDNGEGWQLCLTPRRLATALETQPSWLV